MSKMSAMLDAVSFLAQAAAPAGASGAPAPGLDVRQFLFPLLMIGAMYFLLIAPQRKKQKEHDRMLKALQSGDEIVTTGGIYGVITNVKDDRFVVRIADNTKIELGKSFIATVVKQQAPATDKK